MNFEKRDLKIGLPKINQMDNRVKKLNSYHYVGKIISDRRKINEKVKSHSNYESTKDQSVSMMEKLKDENELLVKKYISEDEMK